MNIFLILLFIITFNFILYINFDRLRVFYNVYDNPDFHRKIHKKKISLLGGFLIFINIIFYYLLLLIFNEKIILFNFKNNFSFILGCTFFFIFGFFDDKKNLNSFLKFFLQFFLMLILISIDNDLVVNKIFISFLNQEFFLENYNYFFTIICFLLFFNAFNMFDGINLQAATYSLFIFLIFFFKINDFLILFVVGGLIIFIVKNYQNKSFLGNSGSSLISFIICYYFFLHNNSKLNFSSEHIFLIMLIPGLELFRLSLIRLSKGRHPFSADNEHIHHIILYKLGYKKTFLIIQFLIILPVAIDFFTRGKITLFLIIISTSLYFLVISYFNKIKKIN